MTYGTYSMYDNQVNNHHKSIHFNPYQKPLSSSGRSVNDGLYYQNTFQYQQQYSQFPYQTMPQMNMRQMPVQQTSMARDCGLNQQGYTAMNQVQPVLMNVSTPNQVQRSQDYYQQNYGKQPLPYSPLAVKSMNHMVQTPATYANFPKHSAPVKVAPPVKYQTPTVGQVLGLPKRAKKIVPKDVGILHEFFFLTPTISELAKRAEKFVVDMEVNCSYQQKKVPITRKELQQSFKGCSGGPIRLNTRPQQSGYVPYRESVVPNTPSPSSSFGQFSPLSIDLSSPTASSGSLSPYM